MNTVLNKVKRAFNQFKGLFPAPLPTGAGAFSDWIAGLVATYDLPTQDVDSIEFCVASMILRLEPTDSTKPRYYFVKSIRAAAAKQVAGDAFQTVKLRQQASAAKQKAEATAQSSVVADASTH